MSKSSFLLSHPGANWQIRGASNFRSKSRSTTNPQKAAREWLGFADAIEAAGAQALVMPAAAVEPPLTGMLYTANAGALFPDGFMVSRMHVAHRLAEAEAIERFVSEWGVAVSRSEHTWEGQAEITTLGENHFILSWGVRSDKESMAEVRAHLPKDAKILEVQLRDPFFHGDTCMAAIDTPKGPVLLACREALVDKSLEDLAAFASHVKVVRVSENDTLAYACNALAIGDIWITPKGLSKELLTQMADLGMKINELELSEVFGKGGGGPRCMVNDLSINAELPSVPDNHLFAKIRDKLVAEFDNYPASLA